MTNFIRTDITAVKFIKNHIYAGIGSSVHIYHYESKELIQKVNALRGQKIYGIVQSECGTKIFIFGGKQFTFLSYDDKFNVTCQDVIFCDDWIHSGIWLHSGKVAVLTAHNVVQIWNKSSLLEEHKYKDNSILYSGLLLPLADDVLVFSGTVYSEVIVQTMKEGPLHYLKGHKGVIFSITCEPAKGIIVTTSDDRSVRIWGLKNLDENYNSNEYWKRVEITCLHELYGHTARVMRNNISNDCIISVGEDGGICFWGFDGMLLRKIQSHQNGCIWSLDANEKHLITGGGDCSIVLHPLSLKESYGESKIINLEEGSPKIIEFTARRNMIILNESNNLIYYNLASNNQTIHKLNHESSYKMLGISACKQIIAIADMSGYLDIFVENCKGDAEIQILLSRKLNIGKFLSLHWAGNRHIVFCSDDGVIRVMANEIDLEVIATFHLPPCKERWLTAVALNENKKLLIVSDRCGHVHIYRFDKTDPVQTFDKVHGRYGATSITIKGNDVITTGRNGTIKYFSILNNTVKYLTCKDIEFRWVEKFLDKNDTYICGFQERVFVVYNLNNNLKLLEVQCGGGHRSWDAVRYVDKVDDSFHEFIRLVYIKNSSIHLHTFQMSKIVSVNVIHGTHSKEINCLKVIKSNVGEVSFCISGGEDTTLRISRLDFNKDFKDISIYKQLSSIRTLKTIELDDNKIIIISAGGRAQICAKILSFENDLKIVTEEILDYLIKGTDKERKGFKNWRTVSIDFDPETRIMDIEIIKADNGFNIYAACSDAYLRIFNLNDKHEFKSVADIKYHKTCILKTYSLKINNKNILLTCTTRGDVAFWDIDNNKIIFETKTNKSGINCVATQILDNKNLLIATGGDDNTIHVVLLKIDLTLIAVIDKWCSDKFHSSQITGLCYLDDMLVSASIDQRVTVLRWSVVNEEVKCEFMTQVFSDVADIQGMDLMEYDKKSISVCVFGKGIEVLNIPIKR